MLGPEPWRKPQNFRIDFYGSIPLPSCEMKSGGNLMSKGKQKVQVSVSMTRECAEQVRLAARRNQCSFSRVVFEVMNAVDWANVVTLDRQVVISRGQLEPPLKRARAA